MAIVKRKCPCVQETSRDPNKTDERAEPECGFCEGIGQLRIRVDNERPPIPTRGFDWVAWLDNQDEDGPQGRGATREAAIDNLLEEVGERMS
jgi:hypothetical protein